ncbi:57R [Xanthomonas phage Xp10]|uniref:57R n=1 Tax=Xanthomonas phage Xp10 TaxID=2907956 RepID=Q7Y5F9_9CAUD|nr:HNH endonuclease [Xanthomonas phage Xp10]AAP58725.1 57R [Xanthomonas phage Xp10]
MKKELTFDQVDQLLSYDADTGLLIWKVSRKGTKGIGSVAGCVNGDGYLQVKVHGKLYQAHRLAWFLSKGTWPSQQLDHINGIKTDNRIVNLRECTDAENKQNRGKSSNNTSGVPGVGWHKQRKKWRAQIKVNGKNIHLGWFDTIEEAAAARAAAKEKYHQFNPVDRE